VRHARPLQAVGRRPHRGIEAPFLGTGRTDGDQSWTSDDDVLKVGTVVGETWRIRPSAIRWLWNTTTAFIAS
jgi:hypothetical protein